MEDGQVVLGGKFPVALVVPGYRHNGTGAVAHQYEIGYPNGQFSTGEGVANGHAGSHSSFFHGGHIRFGHFHMAELFGEGSQLRVVCRCLLCQWMLWCYCQVGCTHKGVGPGGVNLKGLAAIALKANGRALGSTNPVTLHRHHLFRPLIELFQIV